MSLLSTPDNDYGHYWDIEMEQEVSSNIVINVDNHIIDTDPYDEYLDRYEHFLDYEDMQLENQYSKNVFHTSSFIVFVVTLIQRYFRGN
tara:strand:+ start:186 stop:452 length:267 start_codon:yes stop_codon:yes gene_type:complete